MNQIPVFDLHCDVLAYLARVRGANLSKTEDIGAALPHLQAGNVKTQVMAIFTATKSGSTELAQEQVNHFLTLGSQPAFRRVRHAKDLVPGNQIGILAAIENASGFSEEFRSIHDGLRLLSAMISQVGPLAYIGLTHHSENRFGGGNEAQGVGLKADGEALLDFLHGKRIPIDLSHASDALAHDIFTYLDRQGLKVPVIASHSNFRAKCAHVRNLPDELAQELYRRGGIIGINFLRAYIDPNDPRLLGEQVAYGWQTLGGSKGLALGADFFSPIGYPFPERMPLFFPEHENASKYPELLQRWKAKVEGLNVDALAYRNAQEFYTKLWDSSGE